MAKSFSEWKSEREEQKDEAWMPVISQAFRSGAEKIGKLIGRRGGMASKAATSLEVMLDNLIKPILVNMTVPQKKDYFTRLRRDVANHITKLEKENNLDQSDATM